MQGLKYLFLNTAHANIGNSDPGCEAPLPDVPARNVHFFFFHAEDNEYWLNMLTQFVTLPNLDLITAHSSLITAQMCSVTPLF